MIVDGTEIETTSEHPFWVEGEGFVEAGSLRCGDILRLSSGTEARVENIWEEVHEESIPVYNFEVADFHTYFVSELGVLVHNTCTPDDSQFGLKNIYNSIKEAPQYPKGFQEIQNSTKKFKVKNGDVLDELRKVASGEWNKVYKNGYINGKKVSIHYFQHSRTGKVFNVKVKNAWSSGW